MLEGEALSWTQWSVKLLPVSGRTPTWKDNSSVWNHLRVMDFEKVQGYPGDSHNANWPAGRPNSWTLFQRHYTLSIYNIYTL